MWDGGDPTRILAFAKLKEIERDRRLNAVQVPHGPIGRTNAKIGRGAKETRKVIDSFLNREDNEAIENATEKIRQWRERRKSARAE
jgi:hypothetical protein